MGPAPDRLPAHEVGLAARWARCPTLVPGDGGARDGPMGFGSRGVRGMGTVTPGKPATGWSPIGNQI